MICNSMDSYSNRGEGVSVSLELQQKCLELAANGMTNRQIYLEHYSKEDPGLSFESFKRKMGFWKVKTYPNKDLLQKARLDHNQIPHAATVQLNGAGEVTQTWIRTKSNDSVYLKVIQAIEKNPPIPYRATVTRQAGKNMLEIALYDMHFGVNTLEDYKDTLDEILELLSRPYSQINIIVGQDLFHNDDFRGRTTSGTFIESVDIEKAWLDAREFYFTIIMACPVPPKIIYSQGNHDETLGWAFVQTIKVGFPKLEVDDSRRDRKIITFGSNVIGITHGDKVKGKPINLRSIFSIEFPMEFAKATVKEIHAGHLHHEKSEDSYGVMCRTLCTANKTDDWHFDKGFVGQNKRFMVFEWSETKLKSIHYV